MQALLRHLSVHARSAAGVAGRLPAADAALADRVQSDARQESSLGADARAHRSAGQGRDDARAVRERDGASSKPARVVDGEGHGHRPGPAAADVRRECASRSGSAVAHARRGRRPHGRRSRCSRRAWSSTRSPDRARRSSACSSTTASRASCPTVRCAAACRGSTPATPTVPRRSAAQRRRACCRRSRRAADRGAPADVRVHDQRRVPRVPRDRRRAQGRRRPRSTRRSS